ncbi:receptor-transporting protein 1 isoform X3 [Macaca fascicularis]|uniref:receptor-transporting protein 1 isoform X3 n=1 Tax=Macaca fascicularis TaxID=9541 RepID=UPI003D156375
MSPSWLWGPPFFLSSLFYLSSLCSCCLATALSTQRDLILDKRGKDSYALAGPEADCLGSRGHTSQEPPRPPGGALPPIAPPPGHWRPGGPLSSIPASHLLYLLEWDNFLSIPSSFGQIPSAAHACPHPEPFCSTLMVFSGSALTSLGSYASSVHYRNLNIAATFPGSRCCCADERDQSSKIQVTIPQGASG